MEIALLRSINSTFYSIIHDNLLARLYNAGTLKKQCGQHVHTRLITCSVRRFDCRDVCQRMTYVDA